MPPAPKLSLVVAEPQPVSRHGLISLLNSHAGLRVIADTGSTRLARDLCAKLRPDLLVIDPALDDGEGQSLVEELSRWTRNTRVVAFTSREDAMSVQQAFQAGVYGYVTRLDPVQTLLAAVVGAGIGDRHISPRVEALLLERLARGSISIHAPGLESLSKRERQIFRLLGEGRTAREMADSLRVSVKTIESHQERIKDKLKIRTAAELRNRAALVITS
ncbi:MAG TPA: response regulator transcription factor [Chthoniobacteraceae bacterium]|nr:response regulator transcription factor [Chthoniobacteraceae bacterium]